MCKRIVLEMDSIGSKGLMSRKGLAKIRHLDTGLLWIQTHVGRDLIRLKKVFGTENSSDLGTKVLGEKDMLKCLAKIGIVELSGKHALALKCG